MTQIPTPPPLSPWRKKRASMLWGILGICALLLITIKLGQHHVQPASLLQERIVERRTSRLHAPVKPTVIQATTEPEKVELLTVIEYRSPRLKTAISKRLISRKRMADQTDQRKEERVINRLRQDPLHASATEFPVFGKAVFPVSKTPNWGAMYSPTQWNRRYEQMASTDFVPVPRYDRKVLTTSLSSYTKNRTTSINEITAKLFYSTRHMGTYDVDADEYTGTHPGIDIKLASGTPIYSIGGGKVHRVEADSALGKYVTVEHRIGAETFFSIYGHLEKQTVQVGDNVEPGTVIGYSGNTGKSTAPHLHLQIDRDDGTRPHKRYWPNGNRPATVADSYTVHPIHFIGAHRTAASAVHASAPAL